MTAVQRWRAALIGIGVVLLLIGAATLLNDVPPSRYLSIGVWLLAALVIHDGVAAMAIVTATVLVRRVDRRVPFAVVLIVQSAAVVWVIVTVVALPEVVKKAIGTANPSILPLDYLGNLALFSGALAVLTAAAAGACLLAGRRRTRAAPERNG